MSDLCLLNEWYNSTEPFHEGFSFTFLLLFPVKKTTVCSIVLFDTFVNILAHNLAEPAYEADVAQLEYKLVAGEHGLIIRVKGFNHKLPVSVGGIFSFGFLLGK